MKEDVKPQITAGMRGANWDPRLMDRPYQMVPYALMTADGQKTLGFLFTATGKETTVVSIMHPREMAVTHYLVPFILDAGCACWVQGPRSIGNDLRLEHEIALFDVAAGVSHLKSLNFRKVILLGNSGGASLYAFYNQQSLTASEARIAKTPGGRPTKLSELTMPQVDGIVFVSPHPGQGKLLMSGIDPSVVDEDDPMQVNEALDPFSPKNGFNLETGKGKYTEEFVTRYQLAQVERVKKIDQKARQLLAVKRDARIKLKEENALEVKRIASFAPIFNVWRTDADLRSWDISIDPSDRVTGSLWGRDPFVSNWGSVSFARVVTPESWLSTWSGISSNASLEKCAPSIEQPTLLLEYTGDQCTFPGDFDQIYQQVRSSDKVRIPVRGNHHGMALVAGEPAGRVVAGKLITDWLRKFS
ncbi:alpha/beta hydrolase [Noviherbaspirillum saxi]|nr:alpha/beta hydrolase [Noviherbaspirillum saxi]